MSNELEIPDDLKSFLTLKDGEVNLAIVSVVVEPDKKGELISIAALAEDEITKFIVNALANPQKQSAFEELVGNQMTFHSKIDALKKILPEFDQEPKNYQIHLQFLAALKKLRNTAAHSFGLSTADAIKLRTDTAVVAITLDFPKSAWDRLTRFRDYLESLIPH